MLIGDLDLERARRDPDYLAQVRRFLVWPSGSRDVVVPLKNRDDKASPAMPRSLPRSTTVARRRAAR